MRVRCRNCGAISEPTDNYCQDCGKILRRVQAPPASFPPARDLRDHVPDPRDIGNPEVGRWLIALSNLSPTTGCLLILGLIIVCSLASPLVIYSPVVSLSDYIFALFFLICCIVALSIFRR